MHPPGVVLTLFLIFDNLSLAVLSKCVFTKIYIFSVLDGATESRYTVEQLCTTMHMTDSTAQRKALGTSCSVILTHKLFCNSHTALRFEPRFEAIISKIEIVLGWAIYLLACIELK